MEKEFKKFVQHGAILLEKMTLLTQSIDQINSSKTLLKRKKGREGREEREEMEGRSRHAQPYATKT